MKFYYQWAMLLAIGLLLKDARAATIIYAPNNAQTGGGSVQSAVPFGGDPANNQPLPNSRSLTIYHSSLFSVLSAPAWLTEIAFRPDENFGVDVAGGPAVFSDVEVRLSTGSADPQHPHSTFANNIGANETLVYDGVLTFLNPPVNNSGGATPFIWRLTLQTPYLYDRLQGNLIMDVRNIGGMVSGRIFTVDMVNSQLLIGRVYRPSGEGDLPDGIVQSDRGLVTEFDFSDTAPTPEPAALALTGAGLLLALAAQRRR